MSTATIETVSFVHVTMPIGAVQPGDQIERRGFRPEREGLHSWWETVTKVEHLVQRIDVDGYPTFYPRTSLSGERSDFLSCDSNTRILVRPKAAEAGTVEIDASDGAPDLLTQIYGVPR